MGMPEIDFSEIRFVVTKADLDTTISGIKFIIPFGTMGEVHSVVPDRDLVNVKFQIGQIFLVIPYHSKYLGASE